MKKLSLFSFLGLAGLLAFVATPIYAQEENIGLNDENLLDDVENILVVENVASDDAYATETLVDELDYWVDENSVALEEITDESNEEEMMDESNESIRDAFRDAFRDSFDEKDINYIDLTLKKDKDTHDAVSADLLHSLLLWLMWMWLFLLPWLILLIIALWRVFTKAWEAGWKSIIPVYNLYILYKIVWMKNWFWYMIIVPFVLGIIAWVMGEWSTTAEVLEYLATLFAWIVGIVASFRLPRKFGWGVFASILYVIFSGICLLILWFWNYKYEENGEKEETEWKNSETIVDA